MFEGRMESSMDRPFSQCQGEVINNVDWRIVFGLSGGAVLPIVLRAFAVVA